jgi:hypothetical protein
VQPPSVVGATCSSRGPYRYQECIDDWVLQQQQAAAPKGVVGATCSSIGPQYRQSCINKWIIDNLQPPGMIGGCSGVDPANQQACLNALVDQRSSMWPPAPAAAPAPVPVPVPAQVPVWALGSSAGRRLRQSGEDPHCPHRVSGQQASAWVWELWELMSEPPGRCCDRRSAQQQH